MAGNPPNNKRELEKKEIEEFFREFNNRKRDVFNYFDNLESFVRRKSISIQKEHHKILKTVLEFDTKKLETRLHKVETSFDNMYKQGLKTSGIFGKVFKDQLEEMTDSIEYGIKKMSRQLVKAIAEGNDYNVKQINTALKQAEKSYREHKKQVDKFEKELDKRKPFGERFREGLEKDKDRIKNFWNNQIATVLKVGAVYELFRRGVVETFDDYKRLANAAYVAQTRTSALRNTMMASADITMDREKSIEMVETFAKLGRQGFKTQRLYNQQLSSMIALGTNIDQEVAEGFVTVSKKTKDADKNLSTFNLKMASIRNIEVRNKGFTELIEQAKILGTNGSEWLAKTATGFLGLSEGLEQIGVTGHSIRTLMGDIANLDVFSPESDFARFVTRFGGRESLFDIRRGNVGQVVSVLENAASAYGSIFRSGDVVAQDLLRKQMGWNKEITNLVASFATAEEKDKDRLKFNKEFLELQVKSQYAIGADKIEIEKKLSNLVEERQAREYGGFKRLSYELDKLVKDLGGTLFDSGVMDEISKGLKDIFSSPDFKNAVGSLKTYLTSSFSRDVKPLIIVAPRLIEAFLKLAGVLGRIADYTEEKTGMEKGTIGSTAATAAVAYVAAKKIAPELTSLFVGSLLGGLIKLPFKAIGWASGKMGLTQWLSQAGKGALGWAGRTAGKVGGEALGMAKGAGGWIKGAGKGALGWAGRLGGETLGLVGMVGRKIPGISTIYGIYEGINAFMEREGSFAEKALYGTLKGIKEGILFLPDLIFKGLDWILGTDLSKAVNWLLDMGVEMGSNIGFIKDRANAFVGYIKEFRYFFDDIGIIFDSISRWWKGNENKKEEVKKEIPKASEGFFDDLSDSFKNWWSKDDPENKKAIKAIKKQVSKTKKEAVQKPLNGYVWERVQKVITKEFNDPVMYNKIKKSSDISALKNDIVNLANQSAEVVDASKNMSSDYTISVMSIMQNMWSRAAVASADQMKKTKFEGKSFWPKTPPTTAPTKRSMWPIAGGGGWAGGTSALYQNFGTSRKISGAAARQEAVGQKLADYRAAFSKLGIRIHSSANPMLIPSIGDSFMAGFSELSQTSPEILKKLTITSAYRTHQQQAKLAGMYRDAAAKPGMSRHEYGLAMDIGGIASLTQPEQATFLSTMAKHGIGPGQVKLDKDFSSNASEKQHFERIAPVNLAANTAAPTMTPTMPALNAPAAYTGVRAANVGTNNVTINNTDMVEILKKIEWYMQTVSNNTGTMAQNTTISAADKRRAADLGLLNHDRTRT